MRFEWIAAALVASTVACSREPSTTPSPSGAPPSSPSTAPPASAAPADNNRPLPEPLPEVAARVNGHEIRVKTVSSIVEPALQAGRVPHDRRSAAYRQTLDQLVMRELVLQEAQARKIAPDESAVDREYRQTRGQFKSDKEWQDFLVGAGFDDKTFREELRTRHIVDACIRQEMQKQSAVVTDDEAKAFYDQNPSMFDPGERVRASHILLRVPEAAGPDVKKAQRGKAEAALARVRKGEDFAAVAREVSEDPGSAPRGGDLGVFGRGQMVPAFEQAAYALTAGQVSGLVESPFGFHIIKVQERVAAGKVPFETVKAQIKERLAQSRREKAVGDLVQALRAKAKIENYL
jgi:peptidyl-prolyl cis-trans isomerase C